MSPVLAIAAMVLISQSTWQYILESAGCVDVIEMPLTLSDHLENQIRVIWLFTTDTQLHSECRTDGSVPKADAGALS